MLAPSSTRRASAASAISAGVRDAVDADLRDQDRRQEGDAPRSGGDARHGVEQITLRQPRGDPAGTVAAHQRVGRGPPLLRLDGLLRP